MSTRPKDQKVVYEDEVPQPQGTASTAPVTSNGETAVTEKYTVDPFYTVNPERSRDGKWDYTSWTPGLERMFAPTEPQTNWY